MPSAATKEALQSTNCVEPSGMPDSSAGRRTPREEGKRGEERQGRGEGSGVAKAGDFKMVDHVAEQLLVHTQEAEVP